MTIQWTHTAAIAALTFGLGAMPVSAEQGLQPGMRTMIQQGGVEGSVLGPFGPYGFGADPDYGYVYDDRRYGRVVFVDPNDLRRHRRAAFAENPRHVRVRLRDHAAR